MIQNMENIEFCTFFIYLHNNGLLKQKCDFGVPWNISDQISRICCPKLLYFLRKCTKSSKIRPRGAVPLKDQNQHSMAPYLFSRDFFPCYYYCFVSHLRFFLGAVLPCSCGFPSPARYHASQGRARLLQTK